MSGIDLSSLSTEQWIQIEGFEEIVREVEESALYRQHYLSDEP